MKTLNLNQLNQALKHATVNCDQLKGMGFEPLDNKAIAAAAPPEVARTLRNARLYREEDLPRIRKALAARFLSANELNHSSGA